MEIEVIIMSIISRKKKYILKAISVFQQNGLRLSLEEVAAKMGITKKTLYNHFSSKDELLKECIQLISDDFQEAIAGLDDTNHNPIDNFRESFIQINFLFTELSPIFFYDIMKLNPDQAMSEHLAGSGLFQQKIKANLEQGIRQEIYRKDLDIDLVSEYMGYSIFGFYINSIINSSSFISRLYFEEIVDYNLRAIVSEKGKQLL